MDSISFIGIIKMVLISDYPKTVNGWLFNIIKYEYSSILSINIADALFLVKFLLV